MSEGKTVYFTRFEPASPEHGGDWWAAQIWRAVEGDDAQLVRISHQNNPVPRWIARTNRFICTSWRLRHLSAQIETQRTHETWSDDYRDYTRELWRAANHLARTYPLSSLRVAIVDDPLYHIPLVKALQASNVPVVAACHNIESLVVDQLADGCQLECFLRELKLLLDCVLVVTISPEETWLLNNLGVRCLLLPYYPDREKAAHLQAIRDRRKEGAFKGFMLLGTALNPPTRAGQETFLRLWTQRQLGQLGDELLIVGRGTETLSKHTHDPTVQVLGGVSEPDLKTLLLKVRACICYQEQGAGALTKITDCLIAGVPVLANPHAARAHHGILGVSEFGCAHELEQVLRQAPLTGVSFPRPEGPDATDLRAALHSLTNEATENN